MSLGYLDVLLYLPFQRWKAPGGGELPVRLVSQAKAVEQRGFARSRRAHDGQHLLTRAPTVRKKRRRRHDRVRTLTSLATHVYNSQ